MFGDPPHRKSETTRVARAPRHVTRRSLKVTHRIAPGWLCYHNELRLMPDLLQRIAAQPCFKGFKAEHLKTLASDAMQTQFTPGQIIFREGEPAKRFYPIERGKVAVELERRDRAPIGVPLRTETRWRNEASRPGRECAG